MRTSTCLWLGFAILFAVAAGGCGGGGGGGGFSNTPGAGTISITAFAPTTIPGGMPTAFTITGTNFVTASGTTARVIFHALGGATPFAGGTSDTAEVIGTVVNSTTITGTTPAATVCGTASIAFEVTVILESGVKSNTFPAGGGGGLTFTAPTVTSVSPSSVDALSPASITITGTGFGPVGGTVTVRFVGDAGAKIFADGTANEILAVGTVATPTTITVATPKATICGAASATAGIQVTLDGNESCSALAAGLLTYVTPTATGFATSGTGGGAGIARQTIANPFTITGTGYAPVGAVVVVRFARTAGATTPFQGGTSDTVDVAGDVASTTTVTGVTPLAVATTSFTATVQVYFEDGTCTNAFGPVTFNPPPVLTSFVNTRPPFVQSSPLTFNSNRVLARLSTPVQVNGANFVTGATLAIYDAATGPSLPIGSGTLSGMVVTAAQITGGSPTDTSLSQALTQATIRVTNPDLQQGTFTPALFSTEDVLANLNASNLGGNNAEMNIAVNPTNNRNAVICSHDLRTLGGQFSPQVFTARTTDGGATWTGQTVGSAATATTADGFPLGFRGDPMCVSDAFGNFYIGYLDFDQPSTLAPGFHQERIVILQSADGGATWINSTALQVTIVPDAANGLDRCEMGAGRCLGGGAADQAVYVAWHDFQAPATPIQVSGGRSTGLGVLSAFFPVTVVNSAPPAGGTDFHHPSVAVGPNGDLNVSWIVRNSNVATTVAQMNRDPDGLGQATFGFGIQTTITSIFRPNTNVAGFPAPQTNRGYASIPALEVVQAGPFVGRLVCAYDDKFFDDGVPGDEVNFGLRVLSRYSDDGGATWSSPVQAHVLDTRHQFMPWIGSDPQTGNLYVSWYDSIADATNNRAVQRFSAVSSDGASWGNPLLLSQTSSDIATGSDGNDYLEYCGTASSGGVVWSCWCSFQTGNGEVFSSPYQQDP